MRWVLFLTTVLLVNASDTLLQAQESSFAPSDVSTVADSVVTESPSIFDQQAVAPQLDGDSVTSDAAPVTEIVTLPNVTTYIEPNFASNNDVSFSNTAPATPQQRRGQGIGGYFRQASIDAPTEGITLSLLGGGALATRIDEFGGTVGDTALVGDMLGFSVGRRFNSRFRTDFELSWRTADDKGYTRLNQYYPLEYGFYESEVKHFSGLVNFYYDFDRVGGRILTPYIGLGLGASEQQSDYVVDDKPEYNFSDSETMFAIQTMAGFSVNVTARNAFFLESRGFSLTKKNWTNVSRSEAIFGWRHTF